jgi:hypothetical protein
VSSDRQGPTATAAGSTPRLATGQSSHRAGGSTARPSSLARRAKGARPGIQDRVPGRSATIGIGVKNPDGVTAPGAAGRQAPHGAGLATAATSSATPALPPEPGLEPGRHRRNSGCGSAHGPACPGPEPPARPGPEPPARPGPEPPARAGPEPPAGAGRRPEGPRNPASLAKRAVRGTQDSPRTGIY